MRRIFLFFVVITIMFIGCGDEKLANLRLCSDIRIDNPCIGEDTLFLQGTQIWAQLWLEPGFKDSVVTRSIYSYETGNRVFIESMVHELSEDKQVVMELLFLNIIGNFEVEFSDSKGNLLDKKGFEVW